MPPQKELVSALDHYEEAMEKEALGNMGDSLKLYRKAYREETHPSYSPSRTASPALPASKSKAAPADTDGTPPAPCPLSSLPSELLVPHHAGRGGPRRGRLCAPVARLQTPRVPGRHRAAHLATSLPRRAVRLRRDAPPLEQDGGMGSPRGGRRRRRRRRARRHDRGGSRHRVPRARSLRLLGGHVSQAARVRFNGCYISTVNYVRSGQASTNQATWGGAPIHIVTYYRYLRFFRDGTSISLLTTLEPTHVVHHLTRDLLHLHRDNAHAYLPSAAMQRAYKGRWRLSLGAEDDDASQAGPPRGEDELLQEGDVTVETEGVDPKYMFRMDPVASHGGQGRAEQ
ncbi:hypothetical protein J3459_016551 [Metarhizium acridum]|nr:hypothetical protein J3459_016551 [Metarhizium acridum]